MSPSSASAKAPRRVCIFVIAYFAESTLKKVLERIPEEVFERYDTEILVVDDASQDRTFEIGKLYQAAHPQVRMTVLRNSFNQGYGGNQKVGYTYALRNGFDYVVMLHGDGQYAPEMLPQMIEPLAAGKADAVFGSRMTTPWGALKGGMPLYKFVGNRILTTAQNAMLGTQLSEFHSGYRAYSLNALRQVKFHLASNDFHFDTEIIIQMLNARQRIAEIAIPTFYGDEICRVDGMKYAKNVLVSTLKNSLHRAGLLYQRRYDPSPERANTDYDVKLGYTSSHQLALDAVPSGASVLDLSAGPREFAEALQQKHCEVTVALPKPTAATPGVRVASQDLNDPFKLDIAPYSHILLLDVLEHLAKPEVFLDELKEQFSYKQQTLILTTPNVAFFVPRLQLFIGQFNYGKHGILDRTHTRLFTFRSFRRLLNDAGLVVKEVRGIPAPFPKALGNGRAARALLALNELLIRASAGLFSYQILIVAESRPSIDFVLDDTLTASKRAEPVLATNNNLLN